MPSSVLLPFRQQHLYKTCAALIVPKIRVGKLSSVCNSLEKTKPPHKDSQSPALKAQRQWGSSSKLQHQSSYLHNIAKMEEHERATVIIIGGAIAGTVFALQLLSHPTLRSKYRPIIFDSAPNLPGLRISNNVISSDSVGQSGAAVALTKQAIRLLQHLELGSELEAIAQDTEVIEIYRQPLLGLQDGSQSGVRVMEMSEPSGKSLFGGFWAIERGLLQALLVKNVLARGGEVIANKKLQQIIELDTLESAEKNRNELVKALFSDGTSYCGHLLVGADGAWSTVRRHLYTTKSAVGENVVDEGWKPDFQDLQIVYGLSKADTTDTRPIMYSMGLVGGGVGSWSLKNNRQMWHIYEAPCIAPPNTTQSRALSFEADKMLGEKWNAQVTTGGYDQTSTEALLDKHRTVWHPSAGTFGNLFDASETIVRVGLWHKVFTRLGNVRWDPKEKRPKECGKDMGVAGGRGNIVLIGDAAKVLMPTAGQG